MNVLDQARIIVYRMHEKGIEIFLVPDKDGEEWYFLHDRIHQETVELNKASREIIQLEPVTDKDGKTLQAVAVQADWHEIPSLRTLLKTDLHFVKHKIEGKIEQIIPGSEKGTYVALKEAFKKILPQEYAFLKELKEIIIDRNLTQNI